MNDKHVKDFADSVKQTDAYTEAVASLSADERLVVEASVEGLAEMFAPLIKALDELEKSEETMAAVRVCLSKKMSNS